jgi:RES domain
VTPDGGGGDDLLPLPPRKLPQPGFDLLEIEDLVLWRLHWEADPLRPRTHPRGRYRFDAPRNGAEYRVTYGNDARHGAFAEVYGDTRRIKAADRARHLSRIVAERRLRFVPLDDPHVQKVLDLDGRIAMSRQYARTMPWSRALHRWFPDADGIRYMSRHAGTKRNYCLFLDRSRDSLRVERSGDLGDLALRRVLLDAADRYQLAVMIPRPRARR